MLARIRKAAGPCLVLALLILVGGGPAQANEFEDAVPKPNPTRVAQLSLEPGDQAPSIEVTVTPSSAALDGRSTKEVVVIVSNTGRVGIDTLDILVKAPEGIVPTFSSPRSGLKVGASQSFDIRLFGPLMGSSLTSVVVTATAHDIETIASAEILHPQPDAVVGMELVGDDEVTDQRAAQISVLLTNHTSENLDYVLEASADTAELTITSPASTPKDDGLVEHGFLGPLEVAVLDVVIAADRIGTGAAVVRFKLDITGGVAVAGSTTIETIRLKTAPFADQALAGPIGLSAPWLLPGIAGLASGSFVLNYPRRRRGFNAPLVAAPTNLSTVLLVLPISFASIFIYGLLSGVSILDRYRLSDLGLLTALAVATAGAVCACYGWLVWRNRPFLDGTSSAMDVLALVGPKANLETATVRGGAGLVVWEYAGITAITPQIEIVSMANEISAVADCSDTATAARYLAAIEIVSASGAETKIRFLPLPTGATKPATGLNSQTSSDLSTQPIVDYNANLDS